MLLHGFCLSHLSGVTPVLVQYPLSSPTLCCGGENQGSDQHEGLPAAPEKGRSHKPSTASWPTLPFIIYPSVYPPPENASKGISSFPTASSGGKAHLHPSPFGGLQLPKLDFTPFLSRYCSGQKNPSPPRGQTSVQYNAAQHRQDAALAHPNEHQTRKQSPENR